MEPTLDVESFLKTANFDLKVEMQSYQEVVAQLRLDVSNLELREKRKELEDKIIYIGRKEKEYFNEMRRRPHVYGSRTRKGNGRSVNKPVLEADSEDKCLEVKGKTILKKGNISELNGNGNKEMPENKSVGTTEKPQDPKAVVKKENQREEVKAGVKKERTSQVRTSGKKRRNPSQAKADIASEINVSTLCSKESDVQKMKMESFKSPEIQFPLGYDVGYPIAGSAPAPAPALAPAPPGANLFAVHPSETMSQEDFLRMYNLVPTSSLANLRKRRAERKKKSTEDSQFVYETGLKSEDVSPDSLSDKAPTPKKKTHRGRAKKKSIIPSTLAAPDNEEVSQAGSECSSNKSAGNMQKEVTCRPQTKVEAPTNDVPAATESANPEEPAPSVSQYVLGYLKHNPGPSSEPQVETLFCHPNGVPVLLYRTGSDAPDIVTSGSAVISGQTSAVTIASMAQCKSCLNNYPVLGDNTSEFKCFKCKEGPSPPDKLDKNQLIKKSLHLKSELDKLENRALELSNAITEQRRTHRRMLLNRQQLELNIDSIHKLVKSVQAPSTPVLFETPP